MINRRGWVVLALVLAVFAFCATHAHAHPLRHAHHVAPAPTASFWSLFKSTPSLVSAARAEVGNGAVYGRSNLWCARFVNYLLSRTGHKGTGSDAARSFLAFPKTSAQVGAIAILSRRGGGHVGVVSGVDAAGDPIIISGNNAGRVREGAVPVKRVLAFVVPE
jgi:uncharacterized protein (TIGR02594 family)